jgi:glycine/D-amino acid oxidase-like deaminating enzyme
LTVARALALRGAQVTLVEKTPAFEALARCRDRRAARVRAVWRQSRRLGRVAQWRRPLAAARDALFRALPGSFSRR